jgi:hypothetical protein
VVDVEIAVPDQFANSSAADIPIVGEKPLHHFALYAVRETPIRPEEPTGDVSIGASLTRLHDRVVDARQKAGFIRKSCGMARSRTYCGTAEVGEICCV